jgi:molecular chaperone GrpE
MRETEKDAVSETEVMQAAEADETTQAVEEPGTVTQAEYDQVKQERDQLLDRMARMQAEFDNARKRDAKERAEFRDFAIGSSVEQILPVLDNFQLALKAQGTPEQFRSGIELIQRQMEEVLRQMGVQTVEAVGTQFDPRVHEALGSVETAEFPDHQVIDEVRRGYRIKEKLLRPALVRIAVNSAQKEA